MPDKILITQKEFDEFYAIDTSEDKSQDKPQEKPEEKFLNTEEQEYDDNFFEDLPMEDTEQ